MLTEQETRQFKQVIMQKALPVSGALILCAVRNVFDAVDMFTEHLTRSEVIEDGSRDQKEGKEREKEEKQMDETS